MMNANGVRLGLLQWMFLWSLSTVQIRFMQISLIESLILLMGEGHYITRGTGLDMRRVPTADVIKKKDHHSCRNPTGSTLLRDITMTHLCFEHFHIYIRVETI